MSKHLERDLANLQRDLITMASSVEHAIQKAIESLETRNCELAQQVIDADCEIDEEENHVEEECLKMLALHQPVAMDLRRITAVLKINTALERMGDLAEGIAERAIDLARMPPLAMSPKLLRMSDSTTAMVRQSLDAFINLDARLAGAVCRQDDEVDRYNSEIIEELIQTMKTTPALVQAGISMFSAVRHLERIADHATNIAEDVVYLVQGEIVRHRPDAIEKPH